MNDDELLSEIIQAGTFAADGAALGRDHPTQAAMVNAAVWAAFECALGNGLITLVPRERWPEWLGARPAVRPRSAGRRGRQRARDGERGRELRLRPLRRDVP